MLNPSIDDDWLVRTSDADDMLAVTDSTVANETDVDLRRGPSAGP